MTFVPIAFENLIIGFIFFCSYFGNHPPSRHGIFMKKKCGPEKYVYLPQGRKISLPFRLDAVGTVQTPPLLDYDFNDHGNLEFCLRLSSTEPEAYDELDGIHYSSGFPHLFIKSPHCRHRYKVLGKRNAIFFIYPSGSVPLFESVGMHLTPAALEFQITPELSRLLREFRNLCRHSQEHNVADRFDLHCLRILQVIYLQQPHSPQRRYEKEIREIASYFQVNLDTHLRGEEVGEMFGLSRRNFFRYWKLYYPKPPAEYLTDLRMREAIRLLTTRPLQIQEIAAVLGYADCAYFIRTFRSRTGLTPGEYRRKVRASV